MNVIENLISFFIKPESETPGDAPEGYCPNCWGKQEYDTVIRELYRDKQIDVNNHQANYAFIKEFVVNRVDGIRLKKGENGVECPTCRSKQQ